ncbi:MAG: CBS domain-containing protein [Spirochaetes bacterium]|nr:CBS domain-containing protein [Spirochaetota bacterium]
MPDRFPISTEKSPNAIMEVILRLKIKDAMVTKVITADRNATMRDIQNLMKDNKISGVPVLDSCRLIGMVSVNDIIHALDKGHIEEPAIDHMTKSLVVLEDDMPLSFAISYFDKYSYRRFPVIDKNRKFTGMLSSRDVLSVMLQELNKEIKELEEKIVNERDELPNQIARDFFIKKFDFENAGKSSFELKKLLKEKNVSSAVIRRASVASYELEINIAIHSEGGRIVYLVDDEKIEIIANDTGPGIENVDRVVEEGYSTANEWIRSLGFGAGMGIPNTKRVSDEFEITSEIGKGTSVKSVIYLEKKNESE